MSARRKIGLLLGPILFIGVYFWPMHMSVQAHRLLALFAFVITFWLLEVIPIGITALLGAALMVPLGITTTKETFCAFSNPIVMLFLGSFILAEGMVVHNLHRRIALYILSRKWVTSSFFGLIAGIAIIPFFLSMWMSNTATTAMMLPITLGILNLIENKSGKRISTHAGILLLIAYAASIGGIATPVGTPPNLIALGFLKNLGIEIGFFQWMLFALPVAVLTLIFLIAYMYLSMEKPDFEKDKIHEEVKKEQMSLGKMSAGERNVLYTFIVVVILWILPGFFRAIGRMAHVPELLKLYSVFHKYLNEKVVAILGASALFLIPQNIKELKFTLDVSVLKRIDWGTLLLFGGGLSLGTQVFKTGLAQEIGNLLKGIITPTSIVITLFIIVLSLDFLTEITSNTATSNAFIPIIIGVAQAAGLPVLPLVIGGTLAASYAFMLPVATPPNAIVFGSGEIKLDTMARVGFILDIVGALIITFFVYLLV